jgi:hypothetical protein
MQVLDGVKKPILDGAKKVTAELDGSQSTIEFLTQNFPEVLAEGCFAAEKMSAMFSGRKVRRSYFCHAE